MDHVDWLDESAASLLAARLAEQVPCCIKPCKNVPCVVNSPGTLVFIDVYVQLQA